MNHTCLCSEGILCRVISNFWNDGRAEMIFTPYAFTFALADCVVSWTTPLAQSSCFVRSADILAYLFECRLFRIGDASLTIKQAGEFTICEVSKFLRHDRALI